MRTQTVLRVGLAVLALALLTRAGAGWAWLNGPIR